MKVLLIYPPYTGIYGKYQPAAKVGVFYPPMGLMYLAAVLEKEGHEIRILDLELEGFSTKEIVDYIKGFNPSVVGIGSVTPLHHIALKLFKIVKETNRNIITVSGGPHPTALPIETIKESKNIDIVCYGEGEYTLRDVVGAIEKKKRLYGIEGVVYRENGKIIKNPPRELIKNLDDLPFPARHLTKQEKYLWSVPKKGVQPITGIITVRGCPFQCIFCSARVIFGTKVRYRSANSVIKELKQVKEQFGIDHFDFYDDTLGLDRKRTFELCNKMIKENLDITWEGNSRVDVIDSELIAKMHEAGLTRLSFGVESGNQNILDAAKKGTDLDLIKRAYELVDSFGIETRMSIILGLPFETKETIEKTIKFMRSLKCEQAYVNVGTPFPGTEYYDMAKKGYGGLNLLTDDWKEYRRWGNAVINVNDLTRHDLVRYQRKALLKFYLRPKQIIYNLRRAGFKAAVKNGISFARSFLGF